MSAIIKKSLMFIEKIKGVLVEVKLKESLKIVVYYMLVSFLWILFSDKILYMMIKDIEYYKNTFEEINEKVKIIFEKIKEER